MLFNNWAEFQLLVDRLPVFYKQSGFADPCMLDLLDPLPRIVLAPHASSAYHLHKCAILFL